MNKTDKTPKHKPLTVREKKFVNAKLQNMNNVNAYDAAGYSDGVANENKAVIGNRILKKPHIQAAIDEALRTQGITPEWAVKELKKIADQDNELSVKRMALKDILELYGWKKDNKPVVSLQVNSPFFAKGRKVIDGELVEEDITSEPDQE